MCWQCSFPFFLNLENERYDYGRLLWATVGQKNVKINRLPVLPEERKIIHWSSHCLWPIICTGSHNVNIAVTKKWNFACLVHVWKHYTIHTVQNCAEEKITRNVKISKSTAQSSSGSTGSLLIFTFLVTCSSLYSTKWALDIWIYSLLWPKKGMLQLYCSCITSA